MEKQTANEEIHLRNFIFIASDHLSKLKLVRAKRHSPTCLYCPFAASKEGKLIYIYHTKVKKCAFDGFSQIAATPNEFVKFLSEETCSLFWFHRLIFMYHAWNGERICSFRVQVLPCLWVVLFYYTFGFTLSWTANCVSAERWIDILDEHFMDGRKYIFA